MADNNENRIRRRFKKGAVEKNEQKVAENKPNQNTVTSNRLELLVTKRNITRI